MLTYYLSIVLLHLLTKRLCLQTQVTDKNCEDYSIENYTFIISGSHFDSDRQHLYTVPQLPTMDIVKISQNLLENNVFKFKVLASNQFATTETSETTICEFILAVYIVCTFHCLVD